jgi:hypothetical protein
MCGRAAFVPKGLEDSARVLTPGTVTQKAGAFKGEEGTQKHCKHVAGRVAQRLEGSRFVTWQLYRLAAGGSRERLEVRQGYGHATPCSLGREERSAL